jgi:hypothetical protein
MLRQSDSFEVFLRISLNSIHLHEKLWERYGSCHGMQGICISLNNFEQLLCYLLDGVVLLAVIVLCLLSAGKLRDVGSSSSSSIHDFIE